MERLGRWRFLQRLVRGFVVRRFRLNAERCELDEVKTTNMGSLFKLSYTIVMKDASKEKAMLDEIRERNGNLEISCGRPVKNSDQL